MLVVLWASTLWFSGLRLGPPRDPQRSPMNERSEYDQNQDLLIFCLLGGSWVVISGVINPLIWVI